MHGPLHGISMDHAWDRMGPQYGHMTIEKYPNSYPFNISRTLLNLNIERGADRFQLAHVATLLWSCMTT